METPDHQRLKHLALAYLRDRRCLARAAEVRCPISRYRVDVAGYLDSEQPTAGPPRRVPARTVVIECKQSRADFLRDRRDRERLLEQRRALEGLREMIERGPVRRREPELRQSESALFPELESWDYAKSRLPQYRRVLRDLRRLDARVHGQTKFWTIARYALADELYIAAPRGLMRAGEIPPGWGLLECPRRALGDRRGASDTSAAGLRERVPAPPHDPRPDLRARLLRNIAVAATAAADGRGTRPPGPSGKTGELSPKAPDRRPAAEGRRDARRPA